MTIIDAPQAPFDMSTRRTARRVKRTATEMVVDCFAGAGGASLGIEAAIGRCVDLAINHDEVAIRVHAINHPHTRHVQEDIWQADPLEETRGRPVGLLWASPDCTHFSKAKGGKPRKKNIRALAWVVVRWAKQVRPRVIILENVEEFKTWGPLDKQGQPIKARSGETFERWKKQLQRLGYEIEHRELVAADYGVPTTRKRFFLIARCDGQPIVWPKRTHAPRGKAAALKLRTWRAAAECIDWSLPCPSIFLTAEEARAAGVRRPLAEATMRRIAKGLAKFVFNAAEPFIVTCNHGGEEFRGQSPAEPVPTLCASRDAHGLCVPTVVRCAHGDAGRRGDGAEDPQAPLPTLTQTKDFALATAYVQAIDNQSSGQGVAAASEPLRTVVQENRFCAVAAFLNKYHGDRPGDASGRSLDPAEPILTQDTSNRHGVCAAHLQRFLGQSIGSEGSEPAPTLMEQNHDAVCAAWLQKHRGTCRHGQQASEPMATVTGGGTHISQVRAFLVKYFGQGGQHGEAREPLATVTSRDRLGLVTVHGVDYQIVDIGLRMLQPRELLRAQFGRFADDYVLAGTKAQQVAGIGNSVCPELAELLVRANYREKH